MPGVAIDSIDRNTSTSTVGSTYERLIFVKAGQPVGEN
jgi:hypothetical protein